MMLSKLIEIPFYLFNLIWNNCIFRNNLILLLIQLFCFRVSLNFLPHLKVLIEICSMLWGQSVPHSLKHVVLVVDKVFPDLECKESIVCMSREQSSKQPLLVQGLLHSSCIHYFSFILLSQGPLLAQFFCWSHEPFIQSIVLEGIEASPEQVIVPFIFMLVHKSLRLVKESLLLLCSLSFYKLSKLSITLLYNTGSNGLFPSMENLFFHLKSTHDSV